MVECCVCLESFSYYSYRMNCKHDLCEKCAYQMFDANSKNITIINNYGKSCYLSCPLCRTHSILKINERDVYYFDNMIHETSINDVMDSIHRMYKSNEENIPYVFIMYPDGYAFILDPITKYIYDAYNQKYRIGVMKSKHVLCEDRGIKLQTWLHFYFKSFVYFEDFICCGSRRLRF